MLVMDLDGGYNAGVIQGVARFAQRRRDWLIHIHSPAYADPVDVVEDARPDGVIAQITPTLQAALLRLNIPAVAINSDDAHVTVPRVSVDDIAVGTMAAGYLCGLGFRNFGFYGPDYMAHALQRRDGFCSELRRRGFACACRDPVAVHRLPSSDDRTWLARLPRPVAILAGSDHLAIAVAEACRLSGLRVPDEVAILGVDNNLILCALPCWPLSSVVNPSEQIGQRAAAVLDELLQRRSLGLGAPPVLLQPPGVITRQSTNVVAVADPMVAQAVGFIRDHCDQPLSVKEVLDHVAVSRRQLERHFAEAIGRSPSSEVRRAHIERARLLLLRPDLNIKQVAQQSGLCNSAMLCQHFRRELGQTPGEYRRRMLQVDAIG